LTGSLSDTPLNTSWEPGSRMKYGLLPVVEKVQFLRLNESVNLLSGVLLADAIAELILILVNCCVVKPGPDTNKTPTSMHIVPNTKNNFVSIRRQVIAELIRYLIQPYQ